MIVLKNHNWYFESIVSIIVFDYFGIHMKVRKTLFLYRSFFINFIKIERLESWTLSDDNFFNTSFKNQEQITPKSLGHSLNPQSRKDLRQKHQDILNAAQVSNDYLPLAKISYTRPRVLRLPLFIKDHFPLSFFILFFTAQIFETLVENTNVNTLLYLDESIRN